MQDSEKLNTIPRIYWDGSDEIDLGEIGRAKLHELQRKVLEGRINDREEFLKALDNILDEEGVYDDICDMASEFADEHCEYLKPMYEQMNAAEKAFNENPTEDLKKIWDEIRDEFEGEHEDVYNENFNQEFYELKMRIEHCMESIWMAWRLAGLYRSNYICDNLIDIEQCQQEANWLKWAQEQEFNAEQMEVYRSSLESYEISKRQHVRWLPYDETKEPAIKQYYGALYDRWRSIYNSFPDYEIEDCDYDGLSYQERCLKRTRAITCRVRSVEIIY